MSDRNLMCRILSRGPTYRDRTMSSPIGVAGGVYTHLVLTFCRKIAEQNTAFTSNLRLVAGTFGNDLAD
jgi:hypothetical protein